MLLDHEIDTIVARISKETAERLDGNLRAIIREEFKKMSDPLVQAIADLTAATNAELAEVQLLLGDVASGVTGISQAAAAGDAAAVEVQAKALNDSVAAAQAAIAALQNPSPPAVAPSVAAAAATAAPAAAIAPGQGADPKPAQTA